MFYHTYYQSPIGELLLASDGINITGLWIKNQRFFANTLPDSSIKNENLPIFIKTKNWLASYFEGKKTDIDFLPLASQGSDFQKLVWNLLCRILYGTVVTYGDIAQKIANMGKMMSAQAIEGAISHNPISIIVPCHQVVGAKGKLTDYASGLDIKVKLLQLEQVNMKQFFRTSNAKTDK